MLAQARIGMLVQGGAVELRQSMVVLREMPGHPVHDHSQPRLMAAVNELAEVIRIAEPAGRRVVARDLIAPGAVERVLADRHQLDVSEAQALDVRDEVIRQLQVAQRAVALLRHALPRAEVHLVHAHRLVIDVAAGALPHPFAVAPGESRGIPGERGGLLPVLAKEREGVALRAQMAVRVDQLVLVVRVNAHARDEDLPHPALEPAAHRVHPPVPGIEIAHHAHAMRVGRPHGELHPVHPVLGGEVRAHAVIQPLVLAFAKVVQVRIAQAGAKRVRIRHAVHRLVEIRDHQVVRLAQQTGRELRLKQAVLMHPLRGEALRIIAQHHLQTPRGRLKRAHHGPVRPLDPVRPQEAEGVKVTGF